MQEYIQNSWLTDPLLRACGAPYWTTGLRASCRAAMLNVPVIPRTFQDEEVMLTYSAKTDDLQLFLFAVHSGGCTFKKCLRVAAAHGSWRVYSAVLRRQSLQSLYSPFSRLILCENALVGGDQRIIDSAFTLYGSYGDMLARFIDASQMLDVLASDQRANLAIFKKLYNDLQRDPSPPGFFIRLQTGIIFKAAATFDDMDLLTQYLSKYNPTVYEEDYRTMAITAALCCNLRFLRYAKEHGAHNYLDMLRMGAEGDHVEVMQLALEYIGAKDKKTLNLILGCGQMDEESPYIAAIKFGSLHVLHWIISIVGKEMVSPSDVLFYGTEANDGGAMCAEGIEMGATNFLRMAYLAARNGNASLCRKAMDFGAQPCLSKLMKKAWGSGSVGVIRYVRSLGFSMLNCPYLFKVSAEPFECDAYKNKLTLMVAGWKELDDIYPVTIYAGGCPQSE